jgi:hypothetical protein
MFGLGPVLAYMSMLWGRLQQLRDDDRGMTTEAMIITAALAAAALFAVGLIVNAIRNKAPQVSNDINSNP